MDGLYIIDLCSYKDWNLFFYCSSRLLCCFFFFSSRRRHTRFDCDWSSDVCSSDLYEMSRRRELGLDVSWRHALDVFRSPSIGPILALGLMLVAIFLVWIAVAQAV